MNTLPTVLLLAGGDSTRLWPLSDKHSLIFLGKPLAYYALSQLVRFGFKNIIVVVSERNKSLFELLKSEFPGVVITLVMQEDRRGMAGAVLSAKKYIERNPVLIVGPSDVFEDTLVSDFVNYLPKVQDGMLTGIHLNDYFPGGYLKVLNDKVVSIIEKPEREKRGSNIVRLIFDYFKDTSDFLKILQNTESKNDDIYEKAIGILIGKKANISFLSYTGFWGHVKYPWDVLTLSSYFLSKITNQTIKAREIAKSATIRGPVIIESGSRVLDHAVIIGPTYIGKNCIVGNNTLIRESIIGEGSVVGFASEVARSVVGNNCYFHNNYVGDSVISDHVSMGAMATTANFRLDQKSVSSAVNKQKLDTGKVKLGSIIGQMSKVGVHAALMPGIKIGKNSFISSGAIVESDVPDNSFYKSEINFKLVTNKHSKK
ncbi:hypothetical protein A3D77_02255 [Candidatus Gottesmanbacteria bacterium RIFCSPHIGHO2_02_FULL_39_11]|uniref:Uncharacterized protein n=1 Tax=Candidatus Gottesmanbacteria bacterium RIFCSPHIGHO2_02_FULL_39_11 TaxID=1798382 RepID=A0A1F5ZUX8_9BACT|nr:MAG: hypothetical protein A3D77_02255 [Candidatus Gottesmanbacteria bacterium RIFCSPHIGHO2_02_FULL_39_11]